MAPTLNATTMKTMLATPRMKRAGHVCGSGCPCGRYARAHAPSVATKAVADAAAAAAPTEAKQSGFFSERMGHISEHFPTALSADDFLARVEMALSAHGFRGDNSIPVTNLCRDESTALFKTKIDSIFGNSFNINGLGACLTCGCLGFKAGFSHAPNCDGKERYVFFSFPHIGIDSDGAVGKIDRPGRAGKSAACGALIAALGQFQGDESLMKAYAEGQHDPNDPEFAILKQRLGARILEEGLDVQKMTLVDMTALAERTITADLESLINKTVDTSAADFAVVTGVHVHNWANEGSGEPTLEWIAPTSMYIVRDGKRVNINLRVVPSLTPRQLKSLAAAESGPELAAASVNGTTVVEFKFDDPAAGEPMGL